MHAKKIVLRAYVRPKNGYFLAVCIDFNLVAQGETIDAALYSLKDAMVGYLEEVSEHPQLYKGNFFRKSPKSFYVEYYWACVISFLRDCFRKSSRDKEGTAHNTWLVEEYPLNFTGFQLA